MKLLNTGWKLAAVAIVAWPLMDAAALAQRGERSGGGDRGGERSGGGGGGGARSGGGDRGGGGARSSGGGDRGGARNGGGNRSGGGGDRGQSFSGSRTSGGERSSGQRSSGGQRSAGGERSGREFSGGGSSNRQLGGPSPSLRGESGAARQPGNPQRSFYRGPSEDSVTRQRSAANRDVTRDTNINRDGNQNRDLNSRQNFERQRNEFTRDRDGRDRDGANRGERDQLARDRDGERSRNDSRGDFDRDRARDNRDRDGNWNRSDWNQFGQSRNDWRRGGDDIRNSWRYNNRYDMPFRYGWWDSYAGAGWPAYSPYRYSRWQNRPYYWWTWTPAARLTQQLVFGWDRPRYWGYGQGANIYYQDDYVYYDGRRTFPVDTYYQRIYDLAHSVPNISEAEAEAMDWSPLGVFAVQQQDGTESQRALQLAVNRDGVLTGTYFNRESGEVHPLSGMVDKRTQRAAFAFADGEQEALVMETGIYNLTRPESTMMAHYGPSADETEVWQLVRLEQPDETGATQQPTQGTQRSLP